MDAAKRLINKTYHRLKRDSLLRNSMWLLFSTGVMALCGFLFWTICTRHYDSNTIGLASTFISAITLISTLCLLGLNITLINHLPRAKKPSALINSGVIIVTITTLLTALIFLIAAENYSPKLAFLSHSWFFLIEFIIFGILSTVDTLIEGALIAFKDAWSVFVKNSAYSLLKLFLAIVITGAGLIGLFSAYYLGLILCLVISYYALRKHHGYQLRENISKASSSTVMKTSLGNYIESISTVLPLAILPIFITTTLGPSQTAYFYLAVMIASLVYSVPKAVGRNLIAETSSHDSTNLDGVTHYWHAIKVLLAILTPMIIILIIFGKPILGIFGAEYSLNGYSLLVFLTLSVIPISISSLFWAKMNNSRDTTSLLWVSTIGCIEVIALCYILLPRGITALGLAWLVGQIVQVSLYVVALYWQDLYKLLPSSR